MDIEQANDSIFPKEDFKEFVVPAVAIVHFGCSIWLEAQTTGQKGIIKSFFLVGYKLFPEHGYMVQSPNNSFSMFQQRT